MKCYDIGFIQTYIDGELSHDTRKEFTKHLDTCEACQDLLVEISKLNQWENVMLYEESAHSPQEIKIDVEQAWKTFESRSKLDNVSNINHKKQQKKGIFTNMNKKTKRFIYTAVAAAGLFTTAMIPQVQVAATNVASYFSDAITNDKVVNEGIQDENGVTQDTMKNGKYIPIDE
ncbi:zf-HC2 domain-containing protein, partial [Bacillus cereus]|nr:zf-HC2 domain-containing protein [Bacillus cereus]